MANRIFYGWWVGLGSFTTLFTVVGILYYGFPVFYPALIAEFGWDRAEITAGYMISTIVLGPLFGIFAGVLIDRLGSKRIMLAGILSAGIALLSFSFMQSLTHYYLFYFLHTLGYVCAGPVPNQVLISQWFHRLRGRVMGIAYLGLGLGGWVAPRLSNYLISHFGWRTAFQTMGIVALLVLFPLIFILVKSRPSEKGLLPDGAQPGEANPLRTSQSSSRDFTLAEAVRTRAFWAIAVGSVLSIASIGAIIQHLVLYLKDGGYSVEQGARILSFLVLCSIPGRVIMGYLADIFPKKYVMLAAYLCVGAAVPLLLTADSLPMLYLFAFVFGFGMGADYMMIPLVTAQSFGLSSMGKIMGVIFVSDTVGQATFPFLVGSLFRQTGNYQLGFTLVTIAALLGAAAVLFIPRKVVRAAPVLPVAGGEELVS